MKEAFSLINQKERRQIAVLAALLGLTLLFYLFGAVKTRKSFDRSTESLNTIEKNIVAAEESRTQKNMEWKSWEQAHLDVKELRETHFYSSEDWQKTIRLDLQRILGASSIQNSKIEYQYTHFESEKISKVIMEFNVTGSYHSLKTFIHAVESFPKFLAIERIDFLDIDPQGMGIKLRILLAGYYEQF